MSYLGSFIDTRFGFTPTRSDYSPHGNLIYFALDVALAVYFLLGTRHLAELCYGPGDGKPRTLPPDDAQ
jgi:hypothetical protein